MHLYRSCDSFACVYYVLPRVFFCPVSEAVIHFKYATLHSFTLSVVVCWRVSGVAPLSGWHRSRSMEVNRASRLSLSHRLPVSNDTYSADHGRTNQTRNM